MDFSNTMRDHLWFMCHLRMVDNQEVTKRRMSSDLIVNAPPFFVYTPDGDTPSGFFCALFWGWIARIYLYFGKTENLKSPHSGGLKSVKIPQILRLAILGDTGMCQVITAWYVGWMLQKHPCFSLFSSECNEEFLYTNRRPLSIIFTNQRVTK